jgi:hypothetical protein
MKSIKCPRQPDDPQHKVLYVEVVANYRNVVEVDENAVTVEDAIVCDSPQDDWLECEWCGRIDPTELDTNPNLYVEYL